MTLQSVQEIIQERIRDEERLSHDYHQGRVDAFRFVLELLDEHSCQDKATLLDSVKREAAV